jgi:hypothetical protein
MAAPANDNPGAPGRALTMLPSATPGWTFFFLVFVKYVGRLTVICGGQTLLAEL